MKKNLAQLIHDYSGDVAVTMTQNPSNPDSWGIEVGRSWVVPDKASLGFHLMCIVCQVADEVDLDEYPGVQWSDFSRLVDEDLGLNAIIY